MPGYNTIPGGAGGGSSGGLNFVICEWPKL